MTEQTEQPITPEFVRQTTAMSAEVEDRTAQIERYIEEQRIEGLWGTFVEDAEREAGTQPTRFHNARSRQWRVDYVAHLEEGGVRFEGTDYDGDHHSYAIPAGFLFPETRDQAKAAFREYLGEVAARERESRRRDREADLERKRAQIARLEAEIAAESTSS
jgi:hypothetical protein